MRGIMWFIWISCSVHILLSVLIRVRLALGIGFGWCDVHALTMLIRVQVGVPLSLSKHTCRTPPNLVFVYTRSPAGWRHGFIVSSPARILRHYKAIAWKACRRRNHIRGSAGLIVIVCTNCTVVCMLRFLVPIPWFAITRLWLCIVRIKSSNFFLIWIWVLKFRVL